MGTGIGVMAEDLLEDDRPSIRWWQVSISYLLVLSFIPVSLIFGMMRIEVGPRWFMPMLAPKLIGYFFAYAFVLYFFFLWPLLQYVAPVFERRGKKITLVLGLVAFLTPPLLSFSYYLSSGATGLEEWSQLFLTVLPATILASIAYAKTQRHWLFVLILVGTFYIPVYVINDVMARFFPVFQYYPRSEWVLYIRGVASLLAVVVASYPKPKSSPVFASPSREKSQN